MAVALVGIGLIASWVLQELLAGILADDVSMNGVGVTVLALWGVVVVVGVVAVTRARDAHPEFRGISSELLRIASFMLLLLLLAIVTMMTLARPFEWEINNEGCVQRGDVTRCEIDFG